MNYAEYKVEDFMLDESFQRYAAGEHPEDTAHWEEVITRHPEKKAEIEEAKKMLGYLTFQGQPVPQEIFEEDLAKIKAFMVTQPRQQFFRRYWMGLAASIGLLILLGLGSYYLTFLHRKPAPKISKNIKYIEKKVGKGHKLTTYLEDGSKVKINAESKLKIPQHFAADKREVYLEGEAFFEVAGDSIRPFIIHTKHYRTTVLGTSFNIKAYPGEEVIKVAVVTGKVTVEDSLTADNVELAPNQMAVCQQRHIEKTSFDINEELGWKDDILIFKNADIKAMARELERWYGVKVELQNTKNIEKLFTGRFHNENLESILKGMGFALNFTYEIQSDTIRIQGKK